MARAARAATAWKSAGLPAEGDFRVLNIGRVMRMRRINHGMTRDVYQCVDEPEWAAKEELWCPRPEDEGRLRQLGWRPAWQSNELELRALRRGPEARYSIPCEAWSTSGRW
jgi:hypothetical protein